MNQKSVLTWRHLAAGIAQTPLVEVSPGFIIDYLLYVDQSIPPYKGETEDAVFVLEFTHRHICASEDRNDAQRAVTAIARLNEIATSGGLGLDAYRALIRLDTAVNIVLKSSDYGSGLSRAAQFVGNQPDPIHESDEHWQLFWFDKLMRENRRNEVLDSPLLIGTIRRNLMDSNSARLQRATLRLVRKHQLEEALVS